MLVSTPDKYLVPQGLARVLKWEIKYVEQVQQIPVGCSIVPQWGNIDHCGPDLSFTCSLPCSQGPKWWASTQTFSSLVGITSLWNSFSHQREILTERYLLSSPLTSLISACVKWQASVPSPVSGRNHCWALRLNYGITSHFQLHVHDRPSCNW